MFVCMYKHREPFNLHCTEKPADLRELVKEKHNTKPNQKAERKLLGQPRSRLWSEGIAATTRIDSLERGTCRQTCMQTDPDREVTANHLETGLRVSDMVVETVWYGNTNSLVLA